MGYQRRVHGAFQSSCLWIDLGDCVREFIIATNPPCQRWSTYQKRDALSAASARNINPTRSRSTRSPRNASLLRDVGVTTGNRLDMVVRPSPSSERRLRPPRRLYSRWNATSAESSPSFPSRDASTLSSEETRRGRDR